MATPKTTKTGKSKRKSVARKSAAAVSIRTTQVRVSPAESKRVLVMTIIFAILSLVFAVMAYWRYPG